MNLVYNAYAALIEKINIEVCHLFLQLMKLDIEREQITIIIFVL